MTTIECLKELYDEETEEIISFSANFLLTIPRKGYEREHAHAIDRALVLKDLIAQLEATK